MLLCCSVVHQTGGQDQIVLTDMADNQVTQGLQSQTHCTGTSPSAGSVQCASRQPVMARTDAPDGVGDRSQVVTSIVQSVGTSMDQSVCHVQQQQMSTVCIPISRSAGSLRFRGNGWAQCTPSHRSKSSQQ